MKRCGILVLVFLLCAGILTTCLSHNAPVVYGGITDFSLGEDGQLASFTIRRRDNGREQTFSMTEESWVHSHLENISADDFWCGPQLGTPVAVQPGRFGTALSVDVMGWLEKNAASLSDGTPLDIIRWSWNDGRTYCLEDGTWLLTVREGMGPENTSTQGVASLEDLNDTARRKILAYYEEQGLLYDEAAELERAYALWRETGRKYQARTMEQEIFPTASNDRVLYFVTEVSHPTDEGLFSGWQLTAAFDRETGERIENRALFACPEEEILGKLLDAAQLDYNAELRGEMEAVFRIESIAVYPDFLALSFPRGTLSSKDAGYIISADFTGEALDLLQEWAVPDVREPS